MIAHRSPWPRLLVAVLALAAPPLSAQTTASAGWPASASPAARLKAALREAAAAQSRHRSAQGSYAATVAPLRLRLERGIEVDILASAPTGWQARAVHRDRPGLSCVIFVGRIEGRESPRTEGAGEMAGEDGVPLCDRMR